MKTEVVFDLSRLLSRVFHSTPTGIDRVELAYAQGLLEAYGSDLNFAVVHRGSFYGRVSRPAALAFLAFTARRWSSDVIESRARRWSAGVYWMTRMHLRCIPPQTRARVLIQASPHHLHRQALVRAILRREKAFWIVLVHDLIPMAFPEFARRDGDQKHLRRIETIAACASAVVANSHATARELQPYLDLPPELIRVAHLGSFNQSPVTAANAFNVERPFFLMIGTIEPRKNHLLMLNIWRRLSEELDASEIPKLLIVGRRGWENENVVNVLDRSSKIRACVSELAHVSDSRLEAMLKACCAVLMPSFSEGFGMPLTEAFQAGCPAIVSDLPVMREVGQGIPEFVDPLDGVGWMRTILEYAQPGSKLRAAQLGRLSGWRAPTWEKHLDVIRELVDRVQV